MFSGADELPIAGKNKNRFEVMRDIWNKITEWSEGKKPFSIARVIQTWRSAPRSSGAGMIMVSLNGKGVVREVKIDPSIVDPKDIGLLEDLIAAAVNDARSKVDDKVAEKMQEVSGGITLPPGFNLPF